MRVPRLVAVAAFTLELQCEHESVNDEQRRDRDQYAEDREQLTPKTIENPAKDLERQDLRDLLDRALATLPEPQRRTFVLHAEAELSYREVADILQISIGTVMSRLFYARQKLRTYLSKWMKR